MSGNSAVTENPQLHLFALVIGIDEYQNPTSGLQNLTGAVADAKAIYAYLRKNMKVPESRIICLLNKAANRHAILQSFRNLRENSRIKKDDAIFIYFAGHGSDQPAPKGWPTRRNRVQSIVPQDVDTEATTGKRINPITDRTVAFLLNQLADAKGNNITVVLDCCHSSSGTRDAEGVERCATFESTPPLELDEDVVESLGSRSAYLPSIFLNHDLASHVLLAACGSEESALEGRGKVYLGHRNHPQSGWATGKLDKNPDGGSKPGVRGAFTRALIPALEALSKLGAREITYHDLIQRLPPLPNQHPHCEGEHKYRFLFKTRSSGADPSFLNVKWGSGKITLLAGKAQGVTKGSEFELYVDCVITKSNKQFCRLRVEEVEDVRATLKPLPNARECRPPRDPYVYARLVRCGAEEMLEVHFSDALKRVVGVSAVQSAGRASNDPHTEFSLTDAKKAELRVDAAPSKRNSRKAAFFMSIPVAQRHGVDRLPHIVEANAEHLSRVLHFAARWTWHFRREGSKRFKDEVHFEFYRLKPVKEKFDEQDMPVMVQQGTNMNKAGCINLIADPDHYHGVRIVNDSTRDLHAYLFYFDLGDLSITPCYEGPNGGDQVEPSLPAKDSLTIGYGAAGSVPFAFRLKANSKVDVGFLKLFLTASPAEFRSLKQESPFGPDSKRTLEPPSLVERTLKRQVWDTATVTVVQSRGSSSK